MSWKDILKSPLFFGDDEDIDIQGIREHLEDKITNAMAEIANEYFDDYGVGASDDSFQNYGRGISIIFDSMMAYVKAHKGLEFIDREDLR